MTPKEKADELVKKMYKVMSDSVSDITLYFAKQCALVAVDEIIIELTQEISPSVHGFRHQYWKEVKQWIQKIKDKEPGAQWTIEDMKRGKTITIK